MSTYLFIYLFIHLFIYFYSSFIYLSVDHFQILPIHLYKMVLISYNSSYFSSLNLNSLPKPIVTRWG